MRRFTYYKQLDKMDCGPTCLRMIAKYHGRNYSLQKLRELCEISREGVSLLGISEAAEKVGFRTIAAKLALDQLKEAELPAILYWRQNHFVVLFNIKKSKFYVADPAKGIITYSEKEFIENWTNTKGLSTGIFLLLSPTPQFYELEGDKPESLTWSYLMRYLFAYKQLIIQLLLALCLGSILQLVTPFLTQSVVDIGINTRNLNFVYIILIAQVMLFVSSTSVDFIRSWILLHITTRINVSILTDFLTKLMKLPMSFFDTKMTGDIMQRMTDQNRIQTFLTGSTLNTIFSIFNLLIFALVLAYYNVQIFLVFMLGSGIYSIWILLFLKKRRNLDYKRFEISAKNQSNTIQLISGMQEIKLNGCEQQKRWEWEFIQASLFRFSVKNLALGQYQQAGASFINQAKNILITFLSAKAVIDGNITLGAMMAIQYIVGQMNSPVEQFLGFIQAFQDARISLERLNDINKMSNEEELDRQWNYTLPADKSIKLENLTFRYPGAGNEPVLKEINIMIPEGKTTAIVGMSGSGKTTILKLLLKFYQWEKGDIKVGDIRLNAISHKVWRRNCGIVMQDGFIFSDTIANNIAVGENYPDRQKLENAVKMANISDFIESLPNGYNTKIGSEGNGISQGQKQRILIARAIYKDPEYIFFDEATNALDANNERVIMENLNEFFKGRTVVVVAHRLSTVSSADNVIVLNKGKIIEQGTHFELTNLRGEYYSLVKNQLELGA